MNTTESFIKYLFGKKSLCTNLTFSTLKFYKNANTTERQVKH